MSIEPSTRHAHDILMLRRDAARCIEVRAHAPSGVDPLFILDQMERTYSDHGEHLRTFVTQQDWQVDDGFILDKHTQIMWRTWSSTGAER